MRRSLQFLAALFLMLLACVGIWHGIRAARAQAIYWRSKHGADRKSTSRIFANCEAAYRLYPHNYRFSTWTAEEAWYGRYTGRNQNIASHARMAKLWANRGLEMNPYVRELNLVRARSLADDAIDEAIRTWQDYLEWDFWDSFNHAVMVELYSSAGRFEEAAAELVWVKNPQDRDYAQQTIQNAFDAEYRKLQQD